MHPRADARKERAGRGPLPPAVALFVFGCSACGGIVVVDRDTGAAAEPGLDAGPADPPDVPADAPPDVPPDDPPPLTCGSGCATAQAATCSCVDSCGENALEVWCKPTDDGKITCVCTYEDVFSGVCFEDQAPCDMKHGCCAKYFWGK